LGKDFAGQAHRVGVSLEVLVEHDHAQFDFVLNFESSWWRDSSFNLVGRDDDFFRDMLLARKAETMY